MIDIGRSYYQYLLESGIEIHELPDRVHHAKLYRADDGWILTGSPNLDNRSVRLNFELACLFHSTDTAAALDREMEALFARSERIRLNTFNRRPVTQKYREGIVRLFGPIL